MILCLVRYKNDKTRRRMIKILPRVSATSKVVYHGEDNINYSDCYRLVDVK